MANLQLPELWRDDLFEDAFRTFMRPWRQSAQTAHMKVDIKEKDGAYVVKAEMPGVRKEDIDVRIDGGQVSISAESRQEKEEKDEHEHVLRCERYYGYMNRMFTLDFDIDQSQASAKYENGVLELTLPKKAGGAAKRLAVS